MPASAPGETFRFDDFELDVAAYQLRRQGRVVRLERQPMDVLILLVERRRQLVSRADIVERLWGKDVFVDVDTGVHTAIRKIRQALGDLISAPAFVETVPSKGYRFVADVEVVSRTSDPGLAAALVEPSPAPEHLRTNDVAIGELHRRESIEKVAAAPATAAGSDTAPASQLWSAHPARVLMAVVAVALVTGLVAWTRLNGGVSASRVTLAVLPFEYLGSDPEREYLAAGLTEETSASLAQIDLEHLIVKGRTLGYRGTAKTAAEIGRELSVDYLLESTLRAEGSRLRVTTTLIRVGDQEHVWSRSYDRDPTSLLGLQQELSTSIAEQIRLRLSRDNLREVRQRQTQNPDAYDAYLKGRYFHSRRTPATNALATQEYERAIALDSNYALAWAGLASAYAASTFEWRCPPTRGVAAREERRCWRCPRQCESRRDAARRRVSELGTGLGLEGSGDGMPTGDSPRSQQCGGASLPGPRPLAKRPAHRSRVRNAPRARARTTGAGHLRTVCTSCVPGWPIPRRRRTRSASHSHRLAVLDWVHATGASVRADGSPRPCAGSAHGRGAVLG